MKKVNNSRREFITTSVKGAAILTVGGSVMTEILSSCSPTKALNTWGVPTGYEQKPLPYAYDALENIIDAKTMEIHYSKHAASYAKNLAEAAKAESVDVIKPLETVLENISKYSMKMRNNAGGHFNHELFWMCMRTKSSGNAPAGKLADAITKHFGSFEKFKTEFAAAGISRFGSGWAWLYSTNLNELKIGSSPNQDNPIMNISGFKGFPLLGLDVWEHAYYLKYQNKRADYIENWWQVVNWDYVGRRFESQLV